MARRGFVLPSLLWIAALAGAAPQAHAAEPTIAKPTIVKPTSLPATSQPTGPRSPSPQQTTPQPVAPQFTKLDVDGIVLLSTASPDVTKRIADRLRRQLRRYRLLLPPRSEAVSATPQQLTIRLYGTLAAYRAALAEQGLQVDNPACYQWRSHTIWLGFDGAKFDDGLAAARKAQAKATEESEATARQFSETEKEEESRYRRDNVADSLRSELSKARRLAFGRAMAAADQARKAAELKNKKLLDDSTARLLALADHELFHAYAQSEVYAQSSGGMPPWLDEGLAQLVEHGNWRGNGLLLTDVPVTLLVQNLRHELKSGEPPSVASLLALDDKHYLAADVRQTDEVRRRYLFAWGLVQMLAETKRLLPRTKLDPYVLDPERQTDRLAAFARFTKTPQAEFENEWRAWLKKVAQ